MAPYQELAAAVQHAAVIHADETSWREQRRKAWLWATVTAMATVFTVPPTNNAVERALRHAMIWRRIGGGTASEQGSRFVERMLTVVATCRHQGRNVLGYLTACFQADRKGHAIPSLSPVTEPAIKVA